MGGGVKEGFFGIHFGVIRGTFLQLQSQRIMKNHKKSQKITKNHKIWNANHKKSQKITKNHKKSQKITKNTANMVIWPECLQGVDPTLGRRQTPWQCAGQGQMG